LTAAIATLPKVNGNVALALFLCAAAAILSARPNLKRLSMRLSIALSMIAMLIAPFILTGDVDRILLLSLRGVGAATVALAFTSDLSGMDIARALSVLRAPKPIVEVLEGLALQLDSLNNTAARLLLARKLRGARRFSGMNNILPELLVQSAERAERIDLARRLRGYQPSPPARTFARQDFWPLLIAGASAALLHTLAH
jgi:energy-coupling factor transporter transmembrane protein EcfT